MYLSLNIQLSSAVALVSVIFVLFMLSPPDCIIFLHSPFDGNTDVWTESRSIAPHGSALLLIPNCGTPSNTERKVFSSNDFNSSEVELPKRIFEAFTAFSYSSSHLELASVMFVQVQVVISLHELV